MVLFKNKNYSSLPVTILICSKNTFESESDLSQNKQMKATLLCVNSK